MADNRTRHSPEYLASRISLHAGRREDWGGAMSIVEREAEQLDDVRRLVRGIYYGLLGSAVVWAVPLLILWGKS